MGNYYIFLYPHVSECPGAVLGVIKVTLGLTLGFHGGSLFLRLEITHQLVEKHSLPTNQFFLENPVNLGA